MSSALHTTPDGLVNSRRGLASAFLKEIGRNPLKYDFVGVVDPEQRPVLEGYSAFPARVQVIMECIIGTPTLAKVAFPLMAWRRR